MNRFELLPCLSLRRYIHNWWHLALCYIDMGRPQAALAVFDQHIWKEEWREQGSTEVSTHTRVHQAGTAMLEH